MSLLFTCYSSPLPLQRTQQCWLLPSSLSRGQITTTRTRTRTRTIGFHSIRIGNRNKITAFFFNPAQDPIVKQAFKEPVAFLGGMFAGILRLDLNEEPLKEWVTRTVEASGVSEEETNAEGSTTEAAPQEIEIE